MVMGLNLVGPAGGFQGAWSIAGGLDSRESLRPDEGAQGSEVRD